MRKYISILALLAALILLGGCDRNAINKLARLERDKLELQIQEHLGQDYSIEEFFIQNEGYSNGKRRYEMDYQARLNKPALGFGPQILPGHLTFEKRNRQWQCVANEIDLIELLKLPQVGETSQESDLMGLIEGLAGLSSELDKRLLDMTALSIEEENEIGAELRQKILREVGKGGTSKFDVQGVFRKIRAKSSRRDLAWQCDVTADRDFNAFAVAGGKTFINMGMLNALDREDELAFVIAHEIAHNDLKHCVEKIQHSVRAGKINPLFGEVVGIAYNIYKHPYSQEIEYAADKRGVELMTAAGYSKQGAISFFRKLQKYEPTEENPNIQAINDFISNHPTAQKRIERIEQM